MDDVDVAHLAGVFDAAGRLTTRVRQADTAVGYRLDPLVRLRRPSSERALLGKLAAYCRGRDVRYDIVEDTAGAADGLDTWRLEITDPESVRDFLEPMAPYLVARRTPAAILLDKIVPVLVDGGEPTKTEFHRLVGYADKLRAHEAAAGGGPESEPQYTQEFFEDLWYDDLER
ncbi:MAG: hypothetical protein ABEH78_02170 [Haloferacaceae archaeon]